MTEDKIKDTKTLEQRNLTDERKCEQLPSDKQQTPIITKRHTANSDIKVTRVNRHKDTEL